MASAEAEDLPRTNVRRIVRAKLAECSAKKDVQVNKDALLAFAESAKIFIHYLSTAANEICHENKRQTISAADILTAVQELDFPEFVAPLEATLEAFRKENKSKKSESKARSEGKKRKAEVAEVGEAADEPRIEQHGGNSGAEAPVVEEPTRVTDGAINNEHVRSSDGDEPEGAVNDEEETERDGAGEAEEEANVRSEGDPEGKRRRSEESRDEGREGHDAERDETGDGPADAS